MSIGEEIHALARRLWPINRSITGAGLRETLAILKEYCPELTTHHVSSGTKVFDWVVPDEWEIEAGYLTDAAGRKIVDFTDSNLHVVGYSTPVDATLDLQELQAHLYSLPDQPEAVPYRSRRVHWLGPIPHDSSFAESYRRASAR